MTKPLDLTQSPIRAYQALAKQYEAQYVLTLGDVEVDTPSCIIEAAYDAMKQGYTHYEENQGNTLLRETISSLENKQQQTTYTLDEVLICAGATQALACILQTYLKKADEVLVLIPSYPLYKQLILLQEAIYIPIKLSSNFQITPALLEASFTKHTKMLIINHPHNPTGHCMSNHEQQIVVDFVSKHHILLVVDECYVDLQYKTPTTFSKYTHIKDLLFICRSFSKAYAMTGWRIGYILSSKENIRNCLVIHQITQSCIPTFIQQAALTALHTPPLNEHYKQKAETVAHYLQISFPNLACIEAGLYYFLPIYEYETSSEAFCLKLLEQFKVALLPGCAFEYEGWIRLCICMNDDKLKEALSLLNTFLKRY